MPLPPLPLAVEAFSRVLGLANRELASFTNTLKTHGGALGVGAGFANVSRASDVLSAMFGTVLTPALTIFAAGVIATYEVLYAGFLPALQTATSVLGSFAKAMQWFVDNVIKPLAITIRGVMALGDPKALAKAAVEVMGPNGGGNVAEHMRELIADMRLKLAPAGFTGIADAAKRLQVQSFQGMIQQKMLKFFEDALDRMDKIANNQPKAAVGN